MAGRWGEARFSDGCPWLRRRVCGPRAERAAKRAAAAGAGRSSEPGRRPPVALPRVQRADAGAASRFPVGSSQRAAVRRRARLGTSPPPLGGRERRRAASPGRAGWLGPAGRRPPGCGAEAGCEASGTSALGGVSRFGPSAVLWPGGVWESGNLFFSRGRLRIVWLQWPTNFPGCFSWVLRLFRTFGGGFVLSILNTYNPTIFWLGVR